MPRRTLLPAFLHFLIIAAAIAALAASTWSRTADIPGDFGAELYVEWAISTGKVLFRDIAYYFGPLSPLLDALVFRLFGPNLNVILCFNLLILVLTVAALHRILRLISTARHATIAVLFFLVVFAFNSATRITSYNFLTPYSPEVTRGFLVTLLLILCLNKYQMRGSTAAIVMAGILVGIAFLLKPEIFLACIVLFFLVGAAILLGQPHRQYRPFLLAVPAIFLAPLLSLLYFTIYAGFSTALTGTLGGWQYLSKPYFVASPYYRGVMGTDEPLRNALRMCLCSAIYLAIIVIISLAAILIAKFTRRRFTSLTSAILLGILCFVSLFQAGSHIDSIWLDAARGFPLVAIAAVLFRGRQILLAIKSRAITSRLVMEFSLAIISLMFLIKIFLNARIYHYGFVLAAPCAMLIVLALLDHLPNLLQRWQGTPIVFRCAALGLLAAVAFENLTLTRRIIQERSIPIPLALGGTAWDRPANAAAVSAIRFLQSVPGDCAVLPGGAGIDFAAAKTTPSSYYLIDPYTLDIFGEQNMIASFTRHPPKFILLRELDQQFAGVRFFGYDYAQSFSAWIKSHYRYDGKFTQGDHPIELWTHGPEPAKRK